jgi:hypothetical protein
MAQFDISGLNEYGVDGLPAKCKVFTASFTNISKDQTEGEGEGEEDGEKKGETASEGQEYLIRLFLPQLFLPLFTKHSTSADAYSPLLYISLPVPPSLPPSSFPPITGILSLSERLPPVPVGLTLSAPLLPAKRVNLTQKSLSEILPSRASVREPVEGDDCESVMAVTVTVTVTTICTPSYVVLCCAVLYCAVLCRVM